MGFEIVEGPAALIAASCLDSGYKEPVDHRSPVAAGVACDRLRSSRLGFEIVEGPAALIAASCLDSGYKEPVDHRSPVAAGVACDRLRSS
ncbi:hypothetical protein ACFP8Y_11295, partial [Pseudomonas karstica]